jgi:hypothetical protein
MLIALLPVCSFGAGSLYPLMTSAPRDESAVIKQQQIVV